LSTPCPFESPAPPLLWPFSLNRRLGRSTFCLSIFGCRSHCFPLSRLGSLSASEIFVLLLLPPFRLIFRFLSRWPRSSGLRRPPGRGFRLSLLFFSFDFLLPLYKLASRSPFFSSFLQNRMLFVPGFLDDPTHLSRRPSSFPIPRAPSSSFSPLSGLFTGLINIPPDCSGCLAFGSLLPPVDQPRPVDLPLHFL